MIAELVSFPCCFCDVEVRAPSTISRIRSSYALIIWSFMSGAKVEMAHRHVDSSLSDGGWLWFNSA